MENIIEFIANLFVGEGILIAVAAFIIAEIIKKSLDFIPNKYIPLIGGIVGILLGLAVPGVFPDTAIAICAIKGLALGWAATGAWETFKSK